MDQEKFIFADRKAAFQLQCNRLSDHLQVSASTPPHNGAVRIELDWIANASLTLLPNPDWAGQHSY